jgi:D-alanyl-D-alanine carboxypeptidase
MRARPMLVAAVAAALAVAGCGGAAGGRAGGATAAGGATSAGGAATAAPRASAPSSGGASDSVADAAPDVILVRRAGGVPAGWGARLRRIAGVTAVTRATRAQALLRATGARRVRAGFAVPLDTLVVRPRGYARMLPAADRALLARLGLGRALLSRSEARLRRARVGSTLTLAGGRRLRVAGIVADELVRSSELVVSAGEGAHLATRAPYLLAAVRTPRAARRAERVFGTAPRSAVSALGRAPWNRRGLIARTVDLKRRFGEFALRLPIGPDWVTPDPSWIRRDIRSARVPVIGTVTCHRKMIPALRAAMRELVRRGIAHLVDPGDYAGCYAPRRIPTSGTLSLHAWGLAVDLNASHNPQGQKPHQDLRLVHVMERHGFSWGGRWPTVPDGMHFEYHGDGPPSADEPF